MYLAKDFIETSEGLIFAVVENTIEQGRVLCFLRYVDDNKRWSKVNTKQANLLLQQRYPNYLFYSKAKDTSLHGVAIEDIKKHYQPRQRLQALINEKATDNVHTDFKQLLSLYQQQGIDTESLGVTGSLLIGAQNKCSDIDLVSYDRQVFNQLRVITRRLIEKGAITALALNDWQESYRRRGCYLSLDDYIWHEQRKYNKALINGRKFDLSLLVPDNKQTGKFIKRGKLSIKTVIIGDEQGFDYPAIYKVDHPEVSEIVCYTATYVGQAFAGETVEATGLLEQSDQGQKRLIIGSSREAEGEYIKVFVGEALAAI